MANIKPVSDLRNYNEVLRDVKAGSPVYLTRNGRGCYVIVEIDEYEEYERQAAINTLMSELDKGRRSGEEEGYLSLEELDEALRADGLLPPKDSSTALEDEGYED